jgi:hypothetical protein
MNNPELHEYFHKILKLVGTKDARIAELEDLLPNHKKETTYLKIIKDLETQLKNAQEIHTAQTQTLTRQRKIVDSLFNIDSDTRHAMGKKAGEDYAGGYGAFKLLLAKYEALQRDYNSLKSELLGKKLS